MNMNVCKLANKSIKLVDYTFYGTTERAHIDEFDIIDIIMIFAMVILTVLFIAWWVAPIRVIINKLNLKDVRFKCDK
jgi:hypothetical protein